MSSRIQELYIADVDTGHQTKLTEDLGRIGEATFSPDGAKVVFASYNDTGSGLNIYSTNPDGSDFEKLTTSSAWASFSKNRILDLSWLWNPSLTSAYEHESVEVLVLPADASHLEFPPTESNPLPRMRMVFYGYPQLGVEKSGMAIIDENGLSHVQDIPFLRTGGELSPDGLTIAYNCGYHARQGIYLVDVDGNNVRMLKDLNASRCVTIRWSPDGTKLSYANRIDGPLYIIDIETGNEITIENVHGGRHWWSPGGNEIVYDSQFQEPEPDQIKRLLYITDLAGNKRQLTFPEDFERCARASSSAKIDIWAPAWSPDGDSIAFTHCKRLYTISPRGDNLRELADNCAYSPRWSVDGQWIIYLGCDARLYRVSKDGGVPAEIGKLPYRGGPFSIAIDAGHRPGSSDRAEPTQVGDRLGVPEKAPPPPAARQSPATSLDIRDCTWGGGQFVMVGRSSSIITSPDGRTWTAQDLGARVHLTGVAWGNGRFVAVGERTILTSDDGIKWSVHEQPLDKLQDLSGVAWAKDRFIAVGYPGVILTSRDGEHWTRQESGTRQRLEGAAWGNGQFLVAGGATMLASADGEVWKPRLFFRNAALNNVIWTGSQFIAVGEALVSDVGQAGLVATSADGSTWQTQVYKGNNRHLDDVVWSGNRLVAVGRDIQVSPNGSNWTFLNTQPSYGLECVAGDGNLYVGGNSAGDVLTSTDGMTWQGGKLAAAGDSGSRFSVPDSLIRADLHDKSQTRGQALQMWWNNLRFRTFSGSLWFDIFIAVAWVGEAVFRAVLPNDWVARLVPTILYPTLQIIALIRLRGRWRLAAALPLLGYTLLFVLTWSAFPDARSVDMFKDERLGMIMMAFFAVMPPALIYLVVLLVARTVRGAIGRQDNRGVRPSHVDHSSG